jgi:hypothetical protein
MKFCSAKDCDEVGDFIGIHQSIHSINGDIEMTIWLCKYHYNAFLDKQKISIRTQ